MIKSKNCFVPLPRCEIDNLERLTVHGLIPRMHLWNVGWFWMDASMLYQIPFTNSCRSSVAELIHRIFSLHTKRVVVLRHQEIFHLLHHLPIQSASCFTFGRQN